MTSQDREKLGQIATIRSLFRLVRRMGGRVLQFGIRLRFAWSRELDDQADVIAEDALAHSAAKRSQPIVLAFAYSVPVEKIEAYLSDPRVAGVVTQDRQLESYLPTRLLDDPRVGRYWEQRAWSLPQSGTCVYFIGQWRLVGVSMLRQARRHGVQRLYSRCAYLWFEEMKAAHAGASILIRFGLPLLRRLIRYRPEMAFRHILKPPVPHGASLRPIAKRVVLVCSSLAPGGAERQVAYTLTGLASKPVESVQLLCDHLSPGEQHYDFYLPFVKAAGAYARQITTRTHPGHIQHLPHRLREVERYLPSELVADIANLYHEFIDLRPEVVHAWLDWSSIRAGIAAALAGVPKIVLSGRNLNPSHFNLYDFYMDPAYRALSALPNVTLLNNSQAGANDYADWIGIAPERIRVLRNGIDFGPQGRLSDGDIAALRAQYAIPEAAFVVGGVFRLLPEKRPLLWVETAAAVQRRIPDAYFIIFGQGAMKADMEAKARSFGITDRLILAGVTDQVLSAMSIMDVLMLTSYGEGLPNVVLEAQWVGTPVVATRAGGIGEAVDQGVTGWTVDEPSASALAAQVYALHADSRLRVTARARGPAFVRSHFGLKRMIDETWSAYGYDVEAGATRTFSTAKSP